MKILQTPTIYQEKGKLRYLPHQLNLLLEEYVFEQFRADEFPKSNDQWCYVPIFWTNFEGNLRTIPRYANKWFGLKSRKVKKLNSFLERVIQVESRKLFTVVQHADGINFHKHIKINKNILTFASGGVGDIPIPLLCDPRPPVREKKNLLASFKGVIEHPSHDYPFRKVLTEFSEQDGFLIIDTAKGNSQNPGENYVELLSRSHFSLCPRGYGKTSFRLYESIQQGSIPIYIHDGNPWVPYSEEIDWSSFCIFVHYQNIKKLPSFLASISPSDREKMVRNANILYRDYFTLPGVFAYIQRKMELFQDSSLKEIRRKTKCLREYSPPEMSVHI